MGQYVAVAGSGPSAAFFDLDRTLIAGSSAFALATAARKMKMMPTHELLRDAVTAATFKFRGDHDTGAADNARDRVLGFIEGQRQDDLAALNERVLPALLGKIRPEARRLVDMHRHAGRIDLHRVGRAAGDRRAARRVARHDRRDRHARRGRRRRVHRRARRSVLLRARARSRRCSRSPAGRGSTSTSATPTATRHSDLPMLSAVGHPVAVNPDGKLERHARANGWPVVVFSRAHEDGHPPHRRRHGLDGARRRHVRRRTRARQPPATATDAVQPARDERQLTRLSDQRAAASPTSRRPPRTSRPA